jgi:hypothetical protein
MKTYSFDINKMIVRLMPEFLIKPIHLAWLKVLNAPLKQRYADFLIYRQQHLADATINSSVNRLTQALWDKFDSTQSIYLLQSTDYLDEAFIYLESDGATPAYDYLISDNVEPYDYDFLNTEYNSNYNFIVRIPVALVAQTNAIYNFVATYVFSGITFTVQTF